MKIAIAKEHRDFFKKNGWIEFENLLTDQQLLILNQEIDQILSHRLNIPYQKMTAVPEENAFVQGRDLWRSSELLRQLVCLPRIGEIISELTETKPVRIGYDQFIPGTHKRIPHSAEKKYTQFVQREISLEDSSCINGVLAGVLICLNKTEPLQDKSESDIFPTEVGHIVVVQPQHLINYVELTNHPNQKYYLVVYTKGSAYYFQQPNDLHAHILKNQGYIYNDKLSDKHNPIIFR